MAWHIPRRPSSLPAGSRACCPELCQSGYMCELAQRRHQMTYTTNAYIVVILWWYCLRCTQKSRNSSWHLTTFGPRERDRWVDLGWLRSMHGGGQKWHQRLPVQQTASKDKIGWASDGYKLLHAFTYRETPGRMNTCTVSLNIMRALHRKRPHTCPVMEELCLWLAMMLRSRVR